MAYIKEKGSFFFMWKRSHSILYAVFNASFYQRSLVSAMNA